jgi:LysM repeat protein
VALARGKFGIEYDPRKIEREPSGLGWLFLAIALLAAGSLVWTIVGRMRERASEPEVIKIEQEAKKQSEEPPAKKPVVAEEQKQVVKPVAPIVDKASEKRPQKVRNLLMRLAEAEKRCDVEMAVTTIEQIRSLPGSPAADLDDPLARRLGTLNMRRLFELKCAQWVKEVVVKRGDSASRIAVENGSTLASFAKLNGGNVDKVMLGRKMRVMDHPRFTLVIHRRSRTADLSLNGKFFKRYDIQGEVKGKDGAYVMPQQPRTFWRSLGVEFKLTDRAELEMLMPAKASVLVAEF